MTDAPTPHPSHPEGPSSPPDGLAGQGAEQPPARERERDGAVPRVKGSLAPGFARP